MRYNITKYTNPRSSFNDSDYKQQDEIAEKLVFSAIENNNECIWGVKNDNTGIFKID